MFEKDPSGAPHERNQRAQQENAAAGGPSPQSQQPQGDLAGGPHQYTLQFLIAVIKSSRPRIE
jgi:hypothetical protein